MENEQLSVAPQIGADDELVKALTLHRQRRYGEAVDLLGRLVARHRADPFLLAMQGSAYANWGRFEDAANSFSNALVRAPDDPVVYMYRGSAFQFLERHAEAARDFKKAWGLAQGDERVVVAAAVRLRSQTLLAATGY